jgi:KDO2-lipid IV(A) lauroyltransferase
MAVVRTRFGLELVHKHGAARRLVHGLRTGGRMLVLLDQRVRPRDSIEVPFFGLPAHTTSLVARLALKHQTPVVPIYAYPAPGGRYRIVARPAIAAEGSGPDAVRELTALYSAAVEAEIRQQPELWLWMHDRWRLT